MEFGSRVAELFPNEISIVSRDLIPGGCPGLQKLGKKVVHDQVAEILDKVGKASAVAQALHEIITSSEKLTNSDGEQKVYVLCDFSSNQVVGILKIGKKKLFVYDHAGVLHELNPICVLDFYIHESRQRVGCGKVLFEAMLATEHVQPKHLAIDRPSDKFLYFLRKYYNLTQMIPQVNNFVVFDGFFQQRTDYAGKKAKWAGLDQSSTPERDTKKNFQTEFQDSRTYNPQSIHLRNFQSGTPGYHPKNGHVSDIGTILQPPSSNGVNGHHSNGFN